MRNLTYLLLFIFLQGGSCFFGEVREDRLLHFSNKILDVARTATPKEGDPLALVCTSADPHTSCRFTSPNGEEYMVTKDSVTDENGNRVPGISSWKGTDGELTCGILVAAYNPALHYETWKCTLEQKDQYYQYLLGYISLTVEALSNLRLNPSVYPLRYDVALSPNASSKFTSEGAALIQFTGSSTIQLKSDVQTQCIVVHADEMTVHSTETSSPVTHIGIDFQRTFFQICTADGFLPDTLYEVRYDFEVDTLRKGYSQYGLYIKQCVEGGSDLCWFTQGEATNTRNIYPSFDEPAFKAPIAAEVISPLYDTVLSNMPGHTDDGEVYQFQDSEAMSSYLFALAIVNYGNVYDSSYPLEVKVWGSEEDLKAGKADYSANIGPRIIDFYSKLFNVEYPLPKMDLVVEIQKFGAMENWGLILFDPRTLLLDPEEAGKSGISEDRWLVSSVVAHELAHQWFGNLVTLSWWNQMWLNEGFATYVSYLGALLVDPENLPYGRFLVEETSYVMMADSDTTVHWAMTDPVLSRSDIERKFGMFTYQKGGSVIRMMEGILGFEVFMQGLSDYLTAFSFSASTEDDLFFHLENAAKSHDPPRWPGTYTGNKTFTELMKTWTNQAGYPVIYASVRPDPDDTCRLALSQEWFVTNGDEDGEDRTWAVPISIAVSKSNRTSTLPVWWLEDSSELTVDITDIFSPDGMPIVLNADAAGYYRINYNPENWLKIGKTLGENREVIPAMNRVQIFCDITALLKAGYVDRFIYDAVTLDWQAVEDDQIVLWAFESCGSGFKDYVPKFWRI